MKSSHATLILRLTFSFWFCTATSTTMLGQATSQYDRGTPPQLAAGVSSFGSYTSADLGAVNLSNGSLSFAIPLGSVGGRGFSLPLTLNYSSKVWSVNKDTDYMDGSSTVAYASYGVGQFLEDWHMRLTPGWTVGVAPLMNMRAFGIDPLAYPGCGYNRYLTKLTVSLPDKGEIELRDDYAEGAPHLAQTKPNTGNCRWYDGYRGRRWHATDGSGIIFISDVDNAVVNGDLSGVLITRDGMRYRFVNATVPGNPSVLARSTSITDRNGNTITVTYPTSDEVDYTDPLNRVTKIKKNVADPQNGQQLALLVELPGYAGATHYYKVKTSEMNQNYRSDINPALPVINGAYNPQNYYFDNQWWAGGTTLFNESYCLFIERIDAQPVVNELILPDNRSLTFKYNQYGEVAEVQLPTGGRMQYDYQQIPALPTGVSLPAEVQTLNIPINLSGVDRALVARRTYPDGSTLEGSWTYAYTSSTAEARAFSAAGILLRNERHVFMAASRYLQPYNDSTNGTGYSLWSTGLESRSELRNASDVAISATETDWTQRATVSWWTGYTQQQPANDNRPIQQRRYLDNGMMAKTETDYDQYNNPTETREYDFDQTLKRRTTTSYLNANNGFNYATDDSIHLLSLPVTTTIFDAAGTQTAQSTNEYDVYTSDGNHATLTDYASVSQHDYSYGATKSTRGNPTRTGRWLNTASPSIYVYPRYDTLGNIVSTKDGNGNVTTFSFDDDFGLGSNPGTPTQNPATPTYTFPTLITSPPPTPGAPAHTARSEFDYSSGLLTGFRDRNSVVTQTIYNDPFNRPTQVKSALGLSGLETHTTTYYAPQTVLGLTLARNDVLTVGDLNTVDDASIRAWTVTDGFGRTTEAYKRDPQGDVKTSTLYDALGRVKQVSNPFRPSAGEVAIYTTTVYDLAGRVRTVTTPDNALVDTSYSGNTVTVTDQSGKSRKSVTDALGRLTDVYEDPNGLNYQTSYLYDVLDNLVRVTQGGQQRFFMYDSLKRLIRARNPEQSANSSLNLTDSLTGNTAWSIGYQYDADGSLLVKTDARGVATHFEYDALNRLTRRWYNSSSLLTATTHNSPVLPSGVGATDEARFYYDSQTLPSGAPSYSRGSTVGRLVAQVYGPDSNGDYFAYDALGRPTLKFQQTGTLNYPVSASYNLSGAVKTLTYPSGHAVTNSYDNAGRLTTLGGNLGDGTTRTYTTGILYSPSGGLVKEQFGTDTPVYNKLFYNSRGQLAEIRESTSYTGPTDTTWDRGAIINHYSDQCWGMCGGNNSTSQMTDNNGNLKKQEVYIPNDDQVSGYTMRWQQFDYDSLNRLNWAREIKDGVEQWKQQFTYDRWGNRTINTALTYGVGINNKPFAVAPCNTPFDPCSNRLLVPAGQSGTMTYDAAGNLTFDTYTGPGNRTYDAENKITSAIGNSGQTEVYTYDASGQRIKRTVDGVQTWQVYGFGGELLAEYPASGATASPQKEYGYRNGQLLITAEVSSSSPVAWTSAVGVTISGNNLSKVDVDGWNAGAVSTQTINSGDGYVEVTASETNKHRRFGLSNGNTNQSWDDIDFCIYLEGSGTVYINEGAIPRGSFGSYAAGDVFRVAVEGGVVKYRKNGTLLYTSTVSPTYPLLVDTALYSNGATLTNAVIYTGAAAANLHWLITDQLGTPRMVLDQTGALANMKRHDYLPFGEELSAPISGRTGAQGYASGDGVRQHFTQKERDVETWLDYFGARYYASMHGRFAGIDPYDINLERQDASDPEEAEALFRNYISEPQHWNRYTYALNNPLRYVDPDGLYEYETALLGQKIKVHIDDSIIKNDKDALNRIKNNLQKAFDKINSGATKLTADQIESMHSQNRIYVSNDTPVGTVGSTFHITQRMAENPNIDKLAGDIIHDSRHSEQLARRLSYNEANAITMEQEASQFTVDVMNNTGGWDADVFKGYQDDAMTGHLPDGWKDKTTPTSRAKVLEVMNRPQKRRK